jgi:BA14K-like protein
MMAKFPLAAAALGIAFTVAGGPADAQYRWHGGHGAAVGAGIAGFAAGALLGGAIAGSRYYGYAPGYYYGGYAPEYDYGYAPDGYGYAPGVVVGPSAGDAEAYCEQRFRSYNPSTGMYLGYDGRYHPCP